MTTSRTTLGVGPFAGRREEIFQTGRQTSKRLPGVRKSGHKIGGAGHGLNNGFGWHSSATGLQTRTKLWKTNARNYRHTIE